MIVHQLIGLVAADLIAKRTQSGEAQDGVARYLLDRLTPVQIVAICQAILSTPTLAGAVQLRIPKEIGANADLPAEILTEQRATYWRHQHCERPILVIATTDDDQRQSLMDLTPIGSEELLAEPESWVKHAAEQLPYSDTDRKAWSQALKGLREAKTISLERFADYVLATRHAGGELGLAIQPALGWALPSLRGPRDTAFFSSIPANALGHAVRWRNAYRQMYSKRSPYLLKLTPSQQPLAPEVLEDAFQRIKVDVADHHHPIFEAFITAELGWTDASRALAELQWETDNVRALFDGLRVKKEPLGQATRSFFEQEFEETLTDEDINLLERLDSRKTRDPDEDDEDFYERHRTELSQNRTLKAKWERFIFGQAIEADDLRIGLLRAAERLFEQAGENADSRKLQIEIGRRSKREWSEMNSDAADYFLFRYRGLKTLLGSAVSWDPSHVFDRTDQGVDEEAPARRNTSASRNANQMKMTVSLTIQVGRREEEFSTQVIWTFNPNSISSECASDWSRLAKQPFLASRVGREPVSAKGKLQTIDLHDVSTFEPVFRRDRGSLIGKMDRSNDLAKQFRDALKKAVAEQRIPQEGAQTIERAWDSFEGTYTKALEDFSMHGSAAPRCVTAAENYRKLLDALTEHATGDRNRSALWQPVLQIGISQVDGGDAAAIIAPWHPLRLLSTAVQDLQFCGLLRYLLREPSVNFGDTRLFFRDICSELSQPFYPEVCLGYLNREPHLLSVTDSCGEYSLMESPTRWQGVGATKNENPKEAAAVVKSAVSEYLELHPHESANLSVVLYNCDTARLPEATVAALTELHDEDDDNDVRCHVQLRHTQPERLQKLYEALLETSERDEDSVVGSEGARDFMAKLRVGILADQGQFSAGGDVMPADIVFLDEVVARMAGVQWLEDEVPQALGVLQHVPTRGSRRRPAMRDDLRATTYLCSPVQPSVGKSYLRALGGFIRGQEPRSEETAIPARQLSFESAEITRILDEVHRLGHWVINYDELLSRQQLRNLGIRVIRYKRSRHSSPNLLVSSKSPTDVLHVLVQRHLGVLGLPLSPDDISALAQRIIEYANVISGDIVLRAAKRGNFAQELIGLAMSRYMLEDELGTKHPCGWFFLDDYADWLGQKQEHIADVLALSPRTGSKGLRLVLMVSEAKYVSSDGLSKAKKTSSTQLRETIARIEQALFNEPGRLDRDLWLARIADLMLDGIEITRADSKLLHEWQSSVRGGDVEIVLKGYSHVFVHTKGPEEMDPTDRNPVEGLTHAWQEVFGPEPLRDILLSFFHKKPVRSIREALDGDEPWKVEEGRWPAPRVDWEQAVGATPEVDVTPTPPPAPTTRARQPKPAAVPKPARAPRARPQQTATAAPLPAPPVPAETADTLPPAEPFAAVHPVEAAPALAPQVIQDASAPVSSTHQAHQTASLASPAPVPSSNPTSAFQWAPDAIRSVLANTSHAAPVSQADEAWLEKTTMELRSALLSYQLQAKVLDKRLTPNAALIRFQGSDRLTVPALEQRRSQLLTTHGLKVIRVGAEPGALAVSIARTHRETVSLVELLREREVDDPVDRTNRRLVVGVREDDGKLLYLHPGAAHAPHTLIAGTTGSGKSVLLQNLILDIAMTNTVEAAKITLIDPKQGVDYQGLESLPHIEGGLIVEQGPAVQRLESLVEEMDDRYRKFRALGGVNDLAGYNRRSTPQNRLPVRWVIHDEFADWMLVDEYKAAVSSVVQRLGAKARAAGIFLIFAAQRPEDRVMPVQLRDNLGNRLILRVESEGTSRIALQEEGAERLLGKGHLAARLQDQEGVVLAQVPFLPANIMVGLVQATQAQG